MDTKANKCVKTIKSDQDIIVAGLSSSNTGKQRQSKKTKYGETRPLTVCAVDTYIPDLVSDGGCLPVTSAANVFIPKEKLGHANTFSTMNSHTHKHCASLYDLCLADRRPLYSSSSGEMGRGGRARSRCSPFATQQRQPRDLVTAIASTALRILATAPGGGNTRRKWIHRKPPHLLNPQDTSSHSHGHQAVAWLPGNLLLSLLARWRKKNQLDIGLPRRNCGQFNCCSRVHFPRSISNAHVQSFFRRN